MSTTTVKQNIIYRLGEAQSISNTTMLAYAERWSNIAYNEIFQRTRFKSLLTRSVFNTTAGQMAYQAPSDYFGTVFIKDEKLVLLIKRIEQFIAEEQWYIDNGIPYQIGIMLYGPPGSPMMAIRFSSR